MDDAELGRRLSHARAIAGEALRAAMQDHLRDMGIAEPVRLKSVGDRQAAICRSRDLVGMELGGARRVPSPVLGPLGQRIGERIVGLIATALWGDEA